VRPGDGGAAARAHLRRELLDWGGDRPAGAGATVTWLRDRLESDLADLGDDLDAAVASTGRQQLVVTKTRLERLACDGWALDPVPFEHTWGSVRGTLVHKAVERCLDGDGGQDTAQLVTDAWHELAVRRPGDPRSISAWLNACPVDDGAALRRDVATTVETFREVWPAPPADAVDLRTERRLDVALADGRVRLQGTLDLLLDSRVHDDRARALVVDLKTGLPRSDHDRAEVRFYALLAALATGRLPFRWATLYVTEGRPEVEDLDRPILEAVVRRVVDVVRQAARLDAVERGTGTSTLRGGSWCRGCRRREGCDEAARARAGTLHGHVTRPNHTGVTRGP
jgi:hypothetical protein